MHRLGFLPLIVRGRVFKHARRWRWQLLYLLLFLVELISPLEFREQFVRLLFLLRLFRLLGSVRVSLHRVRRIINRRIHGVIVCRIDRQIRRGMIRRI